MEILSIKFRKIV